MKIGRFAGAVLMVCTLTSSGNLVAQSLDVSSSLSADVAARPGTLYFAPAWVDPEGHGKVLEFVVSVDGKENLREKHFLGATPPADGQPVAIEVLNRATLWLLDRLQAQGLEIRFTVRVDDEVKSTTSLGALRAQAKQLLRRGFVAVQSPAELSFTEPKPADLLQALASPTDCLNTCTNTYSACLASCDEHPTARCESGCDNGYSACIADADHDGILYPGDNCPCAASSNQSDCDGDGVGDICDVKNERWVFDADLGARGWDGFTHSYYFSARLEGARRYKNVCAGNMICNQVYKITEKDCTFNLGSGSSESACCDANFAVTLGRLADPTCGTPFRPACHCLDATSPRCSF